MSTTPHARRSLAFALTLLGALIALASVSVACQQLLNGLGVPNAVSCEITGRAVGFDGGAVNKVDVNWYPDGDTGTSSNIQGTVDGDSFTITTLTAEQGSGRVVGELAIGEAPTPPLPLKYGHVRIAIDLPADACVMDLGDVALPLRGSEDDQGDGTDEDEDEDAGTADDEDAAAGDEDAAEGDQDAAESPDEDAEADAG